MPETQIRWRVHLASSPEAVYELLTTDEGRAQFWAESAVERDGAIEFAFVNGTTWRGRVLSAEPPRRYAVEYFGGSRAAFELEPDGDGGTDLTLVETGVPEEWEGENRAGWVNVLLELKAAADFGVDLRNHDPQRSWSQGYCDN
ncbi:MAG: SRPBCC domain-containing protein [Gaiellaceae bacterium]